MNIFIRLIYLSLILSIVCRVDMSAGSYLLPKPQHINQKSGQFLATELATKGLYLQEEMKLLIEEYGLKVNQNSKYSIHTMIVPSLPLVWFNKEEAYRLSVTEREIRVEALGRLGLYRGLQTVAQLLASSPQSGQIDCCEIIDYPAFRWRGLMHDVGRSYIPLQELKKQIKLLSRYKINVFHLHLTEDHAWRLESKLYPVLNSTQSMTRDAGKYYTLQEIKELADYCKALRITLVPEIDMPGHSRAFERALGFGMQTDQGKKVVKQLLKEFIDVVDVPYIHIGTDEVRFVDSNFVPEMVQYVRSLGKKVISWSPGWNYQKGEIDFTHLWSARAKPILGTPAIDSRFHYVNHYDLFSDIVTLYGSKINRVTASNTNVAGCILAVWNDRIPKDVYSLMLDNNVYPSMITLAERAWLGGGWGYFDAGSAVLSYESPEGRRGDFIDFEKRLLWHKEYFFTHEPFPYIRQSHAYWQISSVYDNAGDTERSFAPEHLYKDINFRNNPQPQLLDNEKQCFTYGSGAYLRSIWGDLGGYGLIPSPKEFSTVYAYAWIYSPQKQLAGLLVETQNYSRSEEDLPPPQGHWDYKGSRVWLNGVEIAPPVWLNNHSEKSREIALTNENAATRLPSKVELNEGWNCILLKLPIGKFSLPEVRLNKWMFTCAITSEDGRKALPQIQYADIKVLSGSPEGM